MNCLAKGFLLLVGVLGGLFFPLFSAAQEATDSYAIRRGDVIDVMVMDHPEFSLNGTVVLPDGYIQYPAIGSIRVAGITSQTLSDTLEKVLRRFVVSPMVSIFIRKFENQNLNVFGYVNKPGQYQIFEATDLLSAISKAGGIKRMRRASTVYIIHANLTTEEVNIRDFIGTDSAALANVPLVYAGETVFVKEPREWNWAMISAITSTLALVFHILNLLL